MYEHAPYDLNDGGADKWWNHDLREERKEKYIATLKKYAPNMTEDNVLWAYLATPRDFAGKYLNMVKGSYKQGNYELFQMLTNRPNDECYDTRTPVKNLYCTGGCWHVGTNAGSSESYNCYKIIAKDMNLGKPWEEPGKEEPYSLVEKLKTVRKRVQDTVKKD